MMLLGSDIDFFLVGPQRTASTWIYRNLLPYLDMPLAVKETMFFDRHFDNGFDWYFKHFTKTGLPRGEVAPTYFHSSNARERIFASFPNAHIVITLRDPIDRIESMYRLYTQYGMYRGSIDDFYFDNGEVRESSRYALNVKAWIDLFGENNITILLEEDRQKDPEEFLRTILSVVSGRHEVSPKKEFTHLNEHETENTAKFPFLALLVQRTGDYLRKRGLYFVINAGKAAGLKHLLLGGRKERAVLSVAARNAIEADLSVDIEQLRVILGRSDLPWCN